MRSWEPFAELVAEGLSRLGSILWWVAQGLWDLTVVKSVLGVLALFLIYAALYWGFLVATRRRFLSIAPFRVWMDPPPEYLSEGLASLLGDELVRLQREVRLHGRSGDSREAAAAQFHDQVEPPAPAQVTVEFKGVSPDALNAFIRRWLRRQVVLTGDAQSQGEQLRLIVRASGTGLRRTHDSGPWEVTASSRYGRPFSEALCELAVRVTVSLGPSGAKAVANALAHRQIEAYEDGDRHEALRLARLALIAVPDHWIQFFNLGTALFNLDEHQEAVDAYTEAIELDDTIAHSFNNRAAAHLKLSDGPAALADLKRAHELDPDDKTIEESLKSVKKSLRSAKKPPPGKP